MLPILVRSTVETASQLYSAHTDVQSVSGTALGMRSQYRCQLLARASDTKWAATLHDQERHSIGATTYRVYVTPTRIPEASLAAPVMDLQLQRLQRLGHTWPCIGWPARNCNATDGTATKTIQLLKQQASRAEQAAVQPVCISCSSTAVANCFGRS